MRPAAAPWAGRQAAANDNRPGGGLGAPIDAPDPLHDYRAYILGAFALVLVMGGSTWFRSRMPSRHPAVGSRRIARWGRCRSRRLHGTGWPPRDRNALLLEAMKEELFQLGNRSPAGKDQSRRVRQGQGRAGRDHQARAGTQQRLASHYCVLVAVPSMTVDHPPLGVATSGLEGVRIGSDDRRSCSVLW